MYLTIYCEIYVKKAQILYLNIYILVGFDRIMRPCAARTRILRLINEQNGALCGPSRTRSF